eukprot:gnl/MRDRNA2_/MRDRNA2_76510_c0_seq2.p1 gnl/MRDRNA2_/MRDRNA2_76510_c0~~gnl/MRDRNA2_/MRDRNA2_76510_c0_seq2.p1  ORF type:complete len:289 (+),score=26.83 gnl/MRDRNA2_/MRDRNA2_76510_c0_seq2:159-1025(+)
MIRMVAWFVALIAMLAPISAVKRVISGQQPAIYKQERVTMGMPLHTSRTDNLDQVAPRGPGMPAQREATEGSFLTRNSSVSEQKSVSTIDMGSLFGKKLVNDLGPVNPGWSPIVLLAMIGAVVVLAIILAYLFYRPGRTSELVGRNVVRHNTNSGLARPLNAPPRAPNSRLNATMQKLQMDPQLSGEPLLSAGESSGGDSRGTGSMPLRQSTRHAGPDQPGIHSSPVQPKQSGMTRQSTRQAGPVGHLSRAESMNPSLPSRQSTRPGGPNQPQAGPKGGLSRSQTNQL